MSKQTKEFESWLATSAKYGTAWEAWQHQESRIAELEAQVKQLQRVPLSDSRLLELQESYVGAVCPQYPLDSSDWINFARAIEAAHNIK